jgi:glycosyltransferase involved in cell wall biosynthesis
MIRLVFLTRSLALGGTERQLATLIPRLNKERFETTVITLYGGGAFERTLIEKNIPIINLNKRGRWDLFIVWRLVVELRKIRPTVLCSFLVEPNLLAIAMKLLWPRMRVVWGVRASDVDFSNYDWFTRWNFRLQILFSRFADLVIFNSNAGRDYHFRLGFKSPNIAVIHPAVDVSEFKPERASGAALRQQWAPDEKTILIGLIARLDPIKDHASFLQAAEIVARQRPDCAFVCVGDGAAEYAATLHALGHELGLSDRLVWAGSHTDMAAVYNALDIVCCSSISEGLPNVIAEAMACDLPCVVTDVGDAAILVGNTGVVVPRGDCQALAEGLMRCIDGLGAVARPSPRQRILGDFSVSRLVTQTEAALLATIGERSLNC